MRLLKGRRLEQEAAGNAEDGRSTGQSNSQRENHQYAECALTPEKTRRKADILE
jgi:hypothetical protein